jgi:predicted DNA-binding transcriptional regulator AlpA
MDQRTADQGERIRAQFDHLAGSVLLTEPEAAAVIGYKPSTLKWWRSQVPGRGPQPIYVNGAVRYAVSEIKQWRERQVERGAKGKRVWKRRDPALPAPKARKPKPLKTVSRASARASPASSRPSKTRRRP